MLGRKLSFATVSQRASFTCLQNIDDQLFVHRQRAGTLAKSGLFQIHLRRKAQTIRFIDQPNSSRASTDRGHNADQKLLKEQRRSKILTGHLLNLASKLHHPLTDFFQIFVGRNGLSHKISDALRGAKFVRILIRAWVLDHVACPRRVNNVRKSRDISALW